MEYRHLTRTAKSRVTTGNIMAGNIVTIACSNTSLPSSKLRPVPFEAMIWMAESAGRGTPSSGLNSAFAL
jgi:hypothetical protein